MASKSEPHEYTKNPHFAFPTLRVYIAGSRVQLERYLEAQRFIATHKTNSVWFDRCYYELSSLFENLATVAVTLNNTGVTLPIHQTLIDFRNHIRHDARGEVDQRSDRRNERLGLKDGLQVGIEFMDGGVKIGNQELKADQLALYLDMAENTAYALLIGADVKVDGNGITVSPPKPKN